MIEKIQKQYIFDDAVKQGIYDDDLIHVPQIVQQLLGKTDYVARKYGVPLAPVYSATVDSPIDVSRIIAFFTGLRRDHQVLDTAVTEMEVLISYLSKNMLAREEMVKTRVSNLQKFVNANSAASNGNANWFFTESFHDVSTINLGLSSIWVDTKQGVCFIPDQSDENIVPPSQIQLVDYIQPSGCTFVNTTPQQSFDGSNLTGWKAYLVQDVAPSYTVSIPQTKITYISLDPIGFGVKIKVEVFTDQWISVISDNIYSQSTFPVGQNNVTQVRVTIQNADSTLPKTIGLKNVVLYTASSNRFASLFSTALHPDVLFTDLKVSLTDDLPNGTEINCFYSLGASSLWTPIDPETWVTVVQNNTVVVNDLSGYNFLLAPSLSSSNGLFSYLVSTTSPCISPDVGLMDTGVNQMEVSAVKVDFSVTGEFPHNPTPADFNNGAINTTWSSFAPLASVSGMILAQPYGTNFTSVLNYNQPLIKYRFTDTVNLPYGDLTIVPLNGNNALSAMQYGFVYSFKCRLYCLKQQLVNIGKYWFLQGYRKLTSRTTYRQLGKAYSAFSLLVNGIKVAGDTRPYTIFDSFDATRINAADYNVSNLEEGAANGIDFSFQLQPGWNDVELLISLNDPLLSFSQDAQEVGDPYVQLSIYPNFFNYSFQADYFISQLVGSGQVKPLSQFDLMWNTPKNLKYWGWSPDDMRVIQFNSTSLPKIDNFYGGEYPNHRLTYQGNSNTETQDLFVRLDFHRTETGDISPILHNYSVFAR